MSTETSLTYITGRLDRIEAKLDQTTTIPRLLTLREAAEALGVSQDTVRRLCDRRELRYVQTAPNAAKRIALVDIERWIARHAVEPLRR